jgi:Dehydratase medium subunit
VTGPLVLALVSETAPAFALAAGFEEEGVPLTLELVDDGDPVALAREAAKVAVLGLGVGGDRERLALVLAAAPGRPYLEAAAASARWFGQSAARVAARRLLRYE